MKMRNRSVSSPRIETRERFIASLRHSLRRPSEVVDSSQMAADGKGLREMKRWYLSEGFVQLTALDSLFTYSRYFFLFSDLLIITKQKAQNSYKLKMKVRLDRMWLSPSDCPHSFLIGWPIKNFIAHFQSEEDKNKWQSILNERIEKRREKIDLKFTTISVLVRVHGRNQVMKKKIAFLQTSNDILTELVNELALPQDEEFELSFDSSGDDFGTTLQGPEIIFFLIVDYVDIKGFRLSDAQLERLDTFPLNKCRLVLSSANYSNPNPAQNIVSQLRRVWSRSGSKRFFGKPLEGSAPPQPVLTMIDHLFMNGLVVEGIFRKSPKQSTIQLLKNQLDRGSIPDFCQFSPHVTAALVKEYLRAIPGKILLSGNFELWKAAIEMEDDKRLGSIRNLMQILPSSHLTLLRALLRLFRAIASSEHTKMSAHSLAVCIAPSLLDSPQVSSSADFLPKLAEYLILNAAELLDDFHDSRFIISSAASNDSGLSDVDVLAEPLNGSAIESGFSTSTSPPRSSCLLPDSPMMRYEEWKRYSQKSSSSCYNSSLSDDEIPDGKEDDNDRTPVLSRENSGMQDYAWKQSLLNNSLTKRKTSGKKEKLFSRHSFLSDSQRQAELNNGRRTTSFSGQAYELYLGLSKDRLLNPTIAQKIERSTEIDADVKFCSAPSTPRDSPLRKKLSFRCGKEKYDDSDEEDAVKQSKLYSEHVKPAVCNGNRNYEKNSSLLINSENSTPNFHCFSGFTNSTSTIQQDEDKVANASEERDPTIRIKKIDKVNPLEKNLHTEEETSTSRESRHKMEDNLEKPPASKKTLNDQESLRDGSYHFRETFPSIFRKTISFEKSTETLEFFKCQPFSSRTCDRYEYYEYCERSERDETSDIPIGANTNKEDLVNKGVIERRYSYTPSSSRDEVKPVFGDDSGRQVASINMDLISIDSKSARSPIDRAAERKNSEQLKVRKKNRSILMEPLEVNWSVDQLRTIFQKNNDPIRLNTDYLS